MTTWVRKTWNELTFYGWGNLRLFSSIMKVVDEYFQKRTKVHTKLSNVTLSSHCRRQHANTRTSSIQCCWGSCMFSFENQLLAMMLEEVIYLLVGGVNKHAIVLTSAWLIDTVEVNPLDNFVELFLNGLVIRFGDLVEAIEINGKKRLMRSNQSRAQ